MYLADVTIYATNHLTLGFEVATAYLPPLRLTLYGDEHGLDVLPPCCRAFLYDMGPRCRCGETTLRNTSWMHQQGTMVDFLRSWVSPLLNPLDVELFLGAVVGLFDTLLQDMAEAFKTDPFPLARMETVAVLRTGPFE